MHLCRWVLQRGGYMCFQRRLQEHLSECLTPRPTNGVCCHQYWATHHRRIGRDLHVWQWATSSSWWGDDMLIPLLCTTPQVAISPPILRLLTFIHKLASCHLWDVNLDEIYCGLHRILDRILEHDIPLVLCCLTLWHLHGRFLVLSYFEVLFQMEFLSLPQTIASGCSRKPFKLCALLEINIVIGYCRVCVWGCYSIQCTNKSVDKSEQYEDSQKLVCSSSDWHPGVCCWWTG